MKVTQLAISDVCLIEPQIFSDERGFFYEAFNHKKFNDLIDADVTFAQDNYSFSQKNVLRGLHYQEDKPQGKLVYVTKGEIYDVVVDLRADSPTCGQWVSAVLSADNKKQLWIPPGFAHGFLVLSEQAECFYKTTEYWSPKGERTLRWDDPFLSIEWPLSGTQPILSPKDQTGLNYEEIICSPLEVR